MKEIWNSLITAAQQAKPTLVIKLNCGSNIESIHSLELLLGKNLPKDFIDAYLISDGFAEGSVRLFNGLRLLPIAEMSRLWQAMKEIKASSAFTKDGKEILADANEAIKSDWWNESWLPITDNMSGDYTVLDLAPTEEGTYGQVFKYWHDSSYRTLEASSFKNWMIRAIETLKKVLQNTMPIITGLLNFKFYLYNSGCVLPYNNSAVIYNQAAGWLLGCPTRLS
jgi:cell wall assembly regulator SMI1